MQHFISVNSAYGLKCGLTPLILIKIDRLYIFLPLILRILLHISTSQRFSMFVKSLKKLRIKKQSSALDFYLLSHKMFHRYCQCALCPAVTNRLQKNAQLGEKVETKECLQMRALWQSFKSVHFFSLIILSFARKYMDYLPNCMDFE